MLKYQKGIRVVQVVRGYLPLSGGTLTGDLVLADGKSVESAASNTASILYRLYENGAYVTGLTGQNSATAAYWNFARKVFINDTANTGQTIGLTINQGADTNEILSFKNTAISAHGMTTLTEADTFGIMWAAASVNGGLEIDGVSSASLGLQLVGNVTTSDSTKSSAGVAAVLIQGKEKTGTTTGVCSADANILAVRNYGTTVFIVDEDGDTWQSGGVTATTFTVGTNQVVGARVVDARIDDTIAGAGAYDDTTAGVIDAMRDAMIAHGLISAA